MTKYLPLAVAVLLTGCAGMPEGRKAGAFVGAAVGLVLLVSATSSDDNEPASPATFQAPMRPPICDPGPPTFCR